jgi:Tfp pilus assembly protein PilX
MKKSMTQWKRLSMMWHSDVCQNEDGVALILVMVMLVMLTFIGLAALSTSSTELFLSANYRRGREAFQLAEGMAEEALVDNTNFIVPAAGPGTISNLAAGVVTDTDPSNNQAVTARGTVTFTSSGPAPAGSGMGTKVKANYFIVDTNGTGSLGAVSNQELVMSKIIPGG